MDKDNIIKDKMTKICLCKGIDKFTINECIKDGANTIDKIKEMTGATGGGCKGARCRSKIIELIEAANK
ncbi:(2Fe-2S)-binding protein [Candidatus Arthromitus sp. SFB-rat-Yit]|uniref:(2Fe-2S)-binding protein n=1 Tax=Candidatus Arthromitus sp. SFB-rat-Yit TaxID=1041504 RepID=UPI000227A12C|nr:(2Fe-2S)-binding protein [Candidatus Arthromitus sp. SFB-rat-Yit]BAK81875.1 BFD domain protein (2Fe-2S)-binding domain protein [Candidatus Arthromitus sp. SFB-rat-Yit]